MMTNIINKTFALTATGSDMIENFENVMMAEAALVTIFSMAVVFFSLLAISYLIDLIRVMLGNSEKKKTPVQTAQAPVAAAPAPVAPTQEDDTELIAVITAAIAAMTGAKANGLVVKNIKRISDSDTAWSKTGKIELMR